MIEMGKIKINKLRRFVEKFNNPVEVLPEDKKTYTSRRQHILAQRLAKYGLHLYKQNYQPFHRRVYTSGATSLSFKNDETLEELIDLFDYILTAKPIKISSEDASTYTTDRHEDLAKELAKHGFRFKVPKDGGPRVAYADNYLEFHFPNNQTVELFITFIKEFKNKFGGV